jgi:predicted histone-like DNA-binding protein
MANYRKRYSHLTGKWTPVAAVNKTLSTRKIAERIEKESTVSVADIMAVLYALPHVLRDEMANGNAVKLDGIGSFALTVQCHKTGVDSAEKVDPYKQITNIKVQFRPEKETILVAGEKKMQTTLVANDITWVELQEKKGTKNAEGNTPSGSGSGEEPGGEEPGGGETPGGNTGGNTGGGGNNGNEGPEGE